jgi:hypothetical protein
LLVQKYALPHEGYTEEIAAKVKVVKSENNEHISHVQRVILEKGRPRSKTKHSEDMTEVEEKEKLKRAKGDVIHTLYLVFLLI